MRQHLKDERRVLRLGSVPLVVMWADGVVSQFLDCLLMNAYDVPLTHCASGSKKTICCSLPLLYAGADGLRARDYAVMSFGSQFPDSVYLRARQLN